MDEEKRAQTSEYISTVSATLLALVKLMEGLLVVFALIMVIRGISIIYREAAPDSFSLKELFSEAGKYLSSSFQEFSELSEYFPGDQGSLMQSTISTIIQGAALLVTLLVFLLCPVIEAIAALMLRFSNRGAGVIKTIHRIHMISAIIDLLYAVYYVALCYSNHFKISIFVIIGLFLPLILVFCYHKDLVSAFKTVQTETETGIVDCSFQKTHLSGICILFWIPFASILSVLISYIADGKSTLSFKNPAALITFIFICIYCLKYLFVAACYRNLKRAR